MLQKLLQKLTFIFMALSGFFSASAQDLSGYWQGMDFGPRPNDVTFWPTTMELTQNGNTITGSLFQQATSNSPYHIKWKIGSASVNMNVGEMNFAEIAETNVTDPGLLCDSKFSFTYSADEERLFGTREFSCGMKLTLDLYRLRLKTRNSYCKGETAILEVTGKDVRWYSDPQKSKQLHSGSTYETPAVQTDTFYVTQTFHAVETPPVPVILKVSEPKIERIQVTDASCYKDNGVITVTATGDGPLTYSLDNDPFQTSPVFPSLYPKTYRLTVKAASQCTATRDVNIEKRSPPSFLIVTTGHPCTSETGSVNALAQGGYGSFTYALDNGPFQQSGVFPNLQSGEYTLRAKDSVGCEVTMTVKVADKNAVVVLQDVQVEHAICGGEFGFVSVVATGTGDLQYSLSGVDYVSSPHFEKVKPGSYEVFVKDPSGCIAQKKIVVGKSAAPQIHQVIERNASCGGHDGSVSIYATGDGPLLFSIDAVNYVPDTVFFGLSPLNQTIYLKDTAGCNMARSINITEDCVESIYIPTAFSPDQDGRNEVMDLKFSKNRLKIRHFRLFNRWGTVIAFTNQTVESGHALWDGTYKGIKAQPGTYPYELMVEFENGQTQVIKGTILLLR